MAKIKVAIIGAGPSGMSVAEVFHSAEFKDDFDITIYERNSYIGGKCCTVTPGGEICNGKPDGYDVGATILTTGTPGSKELEQILSKSKVTLQPYTETERPRSAFVSHGAPVNMQPFYIKQFLVHPLSFIKTAIKLSGYAAGYLRHAQSRHTGYAKRPRALNKTLSSKYPRAVNRRLAYLMQGFGYADLDDDGLTPPLLYYHQYYDPNFLNAPMLKVAEGTQGIWAKLAATYPKDSIHLGEEVLAVAREQNKVVISTHKGEAEYDYLVVATPLKPALKYLDLKPHERDFLSQMKYNHYVSVLCETPGLHANTTFNLDACEDKRLIGRVMCAYKRYPDSDITCLYLYAPDGSQRDSDIVQMAAVSLKEDFGVSMGNKANAKVFRWPDYFGHLDTATLDTGWYDEFDNNYQGQNRTLFVSSGLHMETVGASVEYGTKMASKYAQRWSRSK